MTFEQASERESIRQRFLNVDTSNVADALDKFGYPDQGLSSDFRPYPAEGTRLAGFAYTIRGQMTPYEGGGDELKMNVCQKISASEVSVWSGDGEGICYFGELIALGMMERGSVGALIDGGIRDIRWLAHHKFPTFARYRTPVQSIGRWKVNASQIPVYLVGATTGLVKIDPGDFVLADEDGAIVIPAALIDRVLIESERLTATEVDIRRELAAGLSLADALAKFGHV
jgi:regulator of RNase E activity RraA